MPTLYLFIPAHHYQESREGEGKSEHGNFHLSFIIIKSPKKFSLRTRNIDLTKCSQQCLLDENCGYNIENTREQRLAANKGLGSDHINTFKIHPEKAKAAQETQAMERMVLYPHSPW